MLDVVIRPLEPTDSALLRRATLGNLNWCGERFAMDDVLTRPEFAHYAELLPARGDFGQVAIAGESQVGVCWASFLPREDPGYGFVNAQTPEISLWVAYDCRGEGLGRRMLHSLVEEAKHRGVGQLSLSVERDNFARHLYASAGFTDVPGRDAEGVMVLRLRRAR